MLDFLPTHRTPPLLFDDPLDAFCAKDVAASRDEGFVAVVGRVSAHLFEADGALAAVGLEFCDELIVHGGADGVLELQGRVVVAVVVAPAVGGGAQVVVDEFAGGGESDGCLVDGVQGFSDLEQELGAEGATAGHLDGSLELKDGVLDRFGEFVEVFEREAGLDLVAEKHQGLFQGLQ